LHYRAFDRPCHHPLPESPAGNFLIDPIRRRFYSQAASYLKDWRVFGTIDWQKYHDFSDTVKFIFYRKRAKFT
jgi:hypothetical protein